MAELNRATTAARVAAVAALLAVTGVFALPRIINGANAFEGGWRRLFVAYAATAILIFAFGMTRRILVWTSGLRDGRPTSLGGALHRVLQVVVGQRRVLRKRIVGSLHALMFWSFALLFVLFSLSLFGVRPDDLPHGLLSTLYLAVAAGGAFLALRLVLVVRPARGLAARETAVRLVPPLLLFATGVSFFFSGRSTGALFVHFACVMTIFALIPYSRLLHLVAVPLWNIVRPDARLAVRLPFNLAQQSAAEIASADLPLGPRRRDEFPIRSLLAFDACTRCGRCEDVCPAHAAGDAFSPTRVMRHLQDANAPGALSEVPADVAGEEDVDACTTCGHCEEVCPVGLEPLAHVLDLRRSAAFEGRHESGHETVLRRVATTGILWDPEQAAAKELTPPVPWRREPGTPPAELVYWTGCAGRFDPAGQRVAATIAGLLDRAGIRWTTPGPAASCTGDVARRLGDEGLFQQLALHNIALLRQAECRRILVNCAHCFNALAKEYPAFGAEFEVVHHSELLLQWSREGRFGDLQALPARVAFHDPCYLGRHNGRYDAARELLDAVAGLSRVELPESRAQSRCCGAGGGRMWREDEPGARMAVARASQATEVAADTLVTGCPFCLTMLEDPAAKQAVRAQDVSEVIVAALRS